MTTQVQTLKILLENALSIMILLCLVMVIMGGELPTRVENDWPLGVETTCRSGQFMDMKDITVIPPEAVARQRVPALQLCCRKPSPRARWIIQDVTSTSNNIAWRHVADDSLACVPDPFARQPVVSFRVKFGRSRYLTALMEKTQHFNGPGVLLGEFSRGPFHQEELRNLLDAAGETLGEATEKVRCAFVRCQSPCARFGSLRAHPAGLQGWRQHQGLLRFPLSGEARKALASDDRVGICRPIFVYLLAPFFCDMEQM